MNDPGMTSEQRAAIAVHNATQNRMCLNLSGNGQICVACSEVADQIDAAVEVERQAAEERGRGAGIEEAARWHEHRALTVELGLQRKVAVSLDGDDRKYIAKRITADRDDARWLRALNNESSACGPDCPGHPTGALAPRAQASDEPPCATCNHEKFWHQWSSKAHAFCCSPVGDDYCGCKNYLAPRDSGKEG